MEILEARHKAISKTLKQLKISLEAIRQNKDPDFYELLRDALFTLKS